MCASPVADLPPVRRWTSVLSCLAVILAACLGPYAERLRHPSLYADDVVRVAQLQTSTLSTMLFVPFNEHMAPLFQAVSWLTWQLCGRSLGWAPLAFTLASALPFGLTLGLLVLVLQRETRSIPASLAGMSLFALSWLAIETVYWYSASSFMWALLATLAAWYAVVSADCSRRGSLALIASGVASACAPAFSAIGLLAGPVASVRATAGPGNGWRSGRPLVPLSGTLAYLAIVSVFRYHDVLASSVSQRASVGPGLLSAFRAPVDALLPALLGLKPLGATGASAWWEAMVTWVLAACLIARSKRGADRPRVLGGLVLILGGYALAFCARASEPGSSVLHVQRYHLFPMLGLVLLLAPALRDLFGRWDARPLQGFWAAAGLALVLFVLHGREMRDRARFFRETDQIRTLAAIDRLSAICEAEGVTRYQALAALDPIETRWTPAGHNALDMLGPCAKIARVAAPLVKPTLLAALTPEERRSVCGGMDATRYLMPDVEMPAGTDPVASGRVVSAFRVREAGRGKWVSSGRPSYLEYQLAATGTHPRASALALIHEGSSPSGPVEVWWRDRGERWSETRSVRLTLAPGAWRLPLGQVPHWDPEGPDRLRLFFREPGPVSAGTPRLVR